MKFFNLLSILGVVAMIAACGSNQNQSYYPGYGTTAGYNPYNPYYPNNGGVQTGGTQTPLYQNGQIVGYKVRTPIMGGFYSNVTGTSFQQSVQVNAGDRLFVNLSNATYGVATAYCDGKLADMVKTGNRSFPLNNMAILLNGQSVGGGYGGPVTAQASGTLTLSATLSPVTVDCGWLYGNKQAQVLSYFVNLSSMSYYGSGAAVELERCTNLQGAAIACPY